MVFSGMELCFSRVLINATMVSIESLCEASVILRWSILDRLFDFIGGMGHVLGQYLRVTHGVLSSI